jgi:glycosyltransferase involved in cell wall biosynthesis
MKIVHLNKNDKDGGAARAAYRLHRGLRRAGHDSIMVVASRTSDDPAVIAVQRPMDLISRIWRGARQYRIAQDFRRYRASRPSGYDLFSDDRTEYTVTLVNQMPLCDVVNLHWVSGFVDHRYFFDHVPRKRPVVWTLHDMNPLTGGCHYNLGCVHYLHGCKACPQLGSARPRDLSSAIWKRKNKVYSRVDRSQLHIVAPSRWLATEVQQSPLLSAFPVTVIPNGIDVDDIFVPRDQAPIRDLLGIPRTARVVLFVAETTDSRRKGFQFLLDALSRTAQDVSHLFLLSVGSNTPHIDLPIPWLHLGSIDNDRFLSMAYSAADLFAICSVQDNLPNTVLEAMACAIPVIGIAVGGIPDMVRDEITGLTVPPGQPDALARAMYRTLNDEPLRKRFASDGRRIAVAEYSVSLQARRYAALYDDLLELKHRESKMQPA